MLHIDKTELTLWRLAFDLPKLEIRLYEFPSFHADEVMLTHKDEIFLNANHPYLAGRQNQLNIITAGLTELTLRDGDRWWLNYMEIAKLTEADKEGFLRLHVNKGLEEFKEAVADLSGTSHFPKLMSVVEKKLILQAEYAKRLRR